MQQVVKCTGYRIYSRSIQRSPQPPTAPPVAGFGFPARNSAGIARRGGGGGGGGGGGLLLRCGVGSYRVASSAFMQKINNN